MNRILKIGIYFFLFVLFSGCEWKDVEKENPDWSGVWRSFSPGGLKLNVLEIDNFLGSKYGECDLSSCAGNSCPCVNVEGGKARIKKDVLSLGKREFAIDEHPTYKGNDEWRIVLDGITYIRKGAPHDQCANNIQDADEDGVDCGGSGCDNFCYDRFYFKIQNLTGYSANRLNVMYSSGEFLIDAEYDEGTSLTPVPFVRLIFTAKTPGTYKLNSDSYFAVGVDPGAQTVYYDCTSGSINITSLNTSTNKISATFSFTGTDNTTGKSIVIENGAIDNLIYLK